MDAMLMGSDVWSVQVPRGVASAVRGAMRSARGQSLALSCVLFPVSPSGGGLSRAFVFFIVLFF